MSMFDTLADAFADDLVAHLGDEDAAYVLVAGEFKKFPAIVGRLRVEDVAVDAGASEFTSQRDICQVSIRCPAGTVQQKTRLWIRKNSQSIEVDKGEVFHVRTIDSVTDGLTTVQAWRESLAKVQRRGTER